MKESEELKIVFCDVQKAKEKSNTRVSNPKLKIYREFILATLSALTKNRKAEQLKCNIESNGSNNGSKPCQLYALDAMAESGVAGLQWKKHLGSEVHVTLADSQDISVLTSNAERNSLTTNQRSLDGQRVPGDPCCSQSDTSIHVFPADAKALLMTEAFNFVYLYPWKNCVTYFDPACHSIKHGGLLCAVVPDTSVFARSPHVVKRWYAADVIKTEYQREMVARIVLANLARSAGKYNKAIEPQYVLAVDDFLLVCIKITKGHKASELSVKEVSQLLHCRFCEERQFMPQQLAPVENPYNFLSCDCLNKNPGKTAVLLGPMWKGKIFCPSFLRLVQEEGRKLDLSPKFSSLASVLLTEAVCAESLSSLQSQDTTGDQSKLQDTTGQQLHDTTSGSQSCISHKLEESSDSIAVSSARSDLKRTMTKDSPQDENSIKRQKIDPAVELPNVPFYQHVNKLKRVEVPKLDRLVKLIQIAGFPASRTHFDPYSIRTTASVDQFNTSLRKHCSLTN